MEALPGVIFDLDPWIQISFGGVGENLEVGWSVGAGCGSSTALPGGWRDDE